MVNAATGMMKYKVKGLFHKDSTNFSPWFFLNLFFCETHKSFHLNFFPSKATTEVSASEKLNNDQSHILLKTYTFCSKDLVWEYHSCVKQAPETWGSLNTEAKNFDYICTTGVL